MAVGAEVTLYINMTQEILDTAHKNELNDGNGDSSAKIDLANNLHLFAQGGYTKQYSTMEDLPGLFWFVHSVEDASNCEDVFELSSKYEITNYLRITPKLVAFYVTVSDEEMLTVLKLLIK